MDEDREYKRSVDAEFAACENQHSLGDLPDGECKLITIKVGENYERRFYEGKIKGNFNFHASGF